MCKNLFPLLTLILISGCHETNIPDPDNSPSEIHETNAKYNDGGYYYDGQHYPVTYITDGDSVIFKDDISKINYDYFAEIHENIEVEHHPANDELVHYYSSLEVFKKFDLFRIDNRMNFDMVNDQAIKENLKNQTTSNRQEEVVIPPHYINGLYVPEQTIKKEDPVIVKQVVKEVGLFGEIIEMENDTILINNTSSRINYWPLWDPGDCSVHLFDDPNFGGDHFEAFSNFSYTDYNSTTTPEYYKGFTYVTDLEDYDFSERAESFDLVNWSTRRMRVLLEAYTGFCGYDYRIWDVAERQGNTIWSVSYSDLNQLKFTQAFFCSYADAIIRTEVSFGYEDTPVNINWTNTANISITGNDIEKTSGSSSSWYAGGLSANNINDKKIEYVIDSADDEIRFGINYAGVGGGWFDMTNYLHMKGQSDKIEIYYSGTKTGELYGSFKNGDIIMIDNYVAGRKIYYYKNSDYIGYNNIPFPLANPVLYAGVSMYNIGAKCQDTIKRN